MQLTETMFQSPNTVIYDGLPTHGYEGHYKEIVIAERQGYRLVMCAIYYLDGFFNTELYRVEERRKLSDDDKEFWGNGWVAYGVWDVCHTYLLKDKDFALSLYLEKVKIKEHNTYTKLDTALDKELETVNFFISDYEYCNDCALNVLFGGSKFNMLRSLQTLTFKDINGYNYGINHENSFQYADCEEYEDGLNCKGCGTELIPPLENYDEDEEVTGEDLDTEQQHYGTSFDGSEYGE